MSAKRKVVEECSACGYGPIEAVQVSPRPHMHNWTEDAKDIWLCDLCQGTHAGNARIYGLDKYPGHSELFAISYVGNAILAVLRGDKVPRA
jgi:ribosomal protein L37AE/L43A